MMSSVLCMCFKNIVQRCVSHALWLLLRWSRMCWCDEGNACITVRDSPVIH